MSSTDTAELGAAAAHATAPPVSEDWLSLAIGLVIFALALFSLWGVDLLGWVVSAAVWADPSLALAPFSKTYAELGGAGAFIVTYLALLAVLSAGAVALGADVRKFAVAFTAVFWIAYASWIVGNNAHLAAVTPADLQRFGIDWSLRLTNEGGYIIALLAGLVIANFSRALPTGSRKRSGLSSTSRSRSSTSADSLRCRRPGGSISQPRSSCAASPRSPRPI
jgi:hypothetical protein